jgi:hypothetical protein
VSRRLVPRLCTALNAAASQCRRSR